MRALSELGLVAAVVAFSTLSCGRKDTTPIGPTPEKSLPSSTPTAAPTLLLTDVSCTVGGTAPALFVGARATPQTPIVGLRANRFELAAKTGAFVSGVVGALTVRKRIGPGDVSPIVGTLAAGDTFQLEVFGALELAVYGPKAGYPTEARAFRVELAAGTQTWLLTGTCTVGPAG